MLPTVTLSAMWTVILVFNLKIVGGRDGPDSPGGRVRRRGQEDMVIFEGDLEGKWPLDGLFNAPYFDKEMKTNYTVQVGHSVGLPCIVRQIGSKTVSWIRMSDSAILSVDDMLVTYSDRISILKTGYLSKWQLSIRSATPGDSGSYECQVSAEPKLSRMVSLEVQVPVLLIEGSPSILASSGSNISLTCRLKGGTGAGSLAHLQWQHENADGAVTILEEERGHVVQTGPGSWLLLRVGLHSAGNYSCSSQHLNTARVSIIVVHGELTPEAMLEEELKSSVSSDTIFQPTSPVLLLILLYIL